MAVVIKIGAIEATIDGLVWTSESKSMQRALQSTVAPYGPSGADPYPDYTEAEKVVRLFGGVIVKVDPVTPPEPDRVY